MNKYISFPLMLVAAMIFTGCSTQTPETNKTPPAEQEYSIDQADFLDGSSLIAQISESQLNEAEKQGLSQMREEEKLAHDVYTTLGEKWGMKIFTNIASSEQTHTDSVKALLDRYHIQDPAEGKDIGTFASPEISGLYDELTKKGLGSETEALRVGATIEDLDIFDLDNLLSKTDNQDIVAVYNNLKKGSRNHMRAFTSQLSRTGIAYSPEYISPETYSTIINAPQERGYTK